MSKSRVIVESPAKAKTIEKYLGKGFEVRASVGHIMDLPKNDIGVELKKRTFVPELVVSPGKEKVVEQLKKLAAKSDEIYLAPDPDREGEGVGGPRVDLHLRAVDRDRDRGVEGVVAQLGHRDPLALGVELLEHVGEQVVSHRPRRRGALQLHQDRRRLRVPDPDRQELVPVGCLQKDDRLLADEIEADPVDVHLMHGAVPDLTPNIAQAAPGETTAGSGHGRRRYNARPRGRLAQLVRAPL